MPRILAALVILLPATVNADVISHDDVAPNCPPSTCAPGTTPWSGGHGSCSPGCRPADVCESDAECPAAGYRCVATRFCLAERYPGNSHVTVVTSECAADGSCAEGECSSERRCVAPARPPAAPAASREAEDGGGCSAVGGPAGRSCGWGLLAFSLGLAFVGRRRLM